MGWRSIRCLALAIHSRQPSLCNPYNRRRSTFRNSLGSSKPHSQAASAVTAAAGQGEPSFDLADAVHLAAASFAAYIIPTNESAYPYRDRYEDGSVVFYQSLPFVQEHFSSIVLVEFKSLSGIKWPQADKPGKPSAVVTCAASTAYVAATRYEDQATWSEKHYVYVPKGKAATIEIELSDDTYYLDHPMATIEVEVEDLLAAGVDSRDFALPRFSDKAVLKVDFTVVPLSGTVEGPAKAVRDDIFTQLAKPALALGEGLSTPLKQAASAAASCAACPMVEVGNLPETAVEGVAVERNAWEELSSGWRTLLLALGKDLDNLGAVAYLFNGDMQGWIMKNDAAKEVVVSFRGSEQVLGDWLTNFRIKLVDLDIGDADDETSFLDRITPLFRRDQMVHKGFNLGWESLSARVHKLISLCTAEDESWKIYVTGHSMGGALATLCAYELGRDKNYDVRVYTYGSPRVGNSKFAEKFNSHVPNSWRVKNDYDVVTVIPPSRRFHHVAHGIVALESGMIHAVDNDPPINLCLYPGGPDAEELRVKLVEGYKESLEGRTVERATHDESTLSAIQKIIKEGVADHSHDEYLDTLCAIVAKANDDPSVKQKLQAVQNMLAAFRTQSV